jgi:predicted DNA binding CopG/RHH family protein
MSKQAKTAKKFKSKAEQRTFWEESDSTQLIDWSRAQRANFSNLKPSTQSISLRLPVHLLRRIKVAANARDVPYQSLIKIWLEEKLSA